MDEAFGAYFPDTLESLESLGAELREFSPLRSESLPEDVDLVMIGCGFPDCHAQDLAANVSLIAALRSFVCQGGRLYAESGGTAYLSRTMVIDGMVVPVQGFFRSRPNGSACPPFRARSSALWTGRAGSGRAAWWCAATAQADGHFTRLPSPMIVRLAPGS